MKKYTLILVSEFLIHPLVYIREFSGDVCISHEFLSEIPYIFSIKLFAIFFIQSLILLRARQHQYWRMIVYFLYVHLIVRSSTFYYSLWNQISRTVAVKKFLSAQHLK
jgi:hypothetical protein